LINPREFFIAGIALCWAEGFKNKHEYRLGFCNSDPDMIKFYLYWLNNSLGIKKENLVARLTLNVSCQNQVKEIEQYWSQVTSIPLSQFAKLILSAYTMGIIIEFFEYILKGVYIIYFKMD
jgi:hypothetical protein